MEWTRRRGDVSIGMSPYLIIDDEADQASVDTRTMAIDEDGKPDDEHNPTRVNELIRRLLIAFEKSAYVGYTATPFASIFIHERARTKELGEDLFPRSFIINLPAPSNYTGAARVFGIKDDGSTNLEERDPLPIMRPVKDHADSTRVTKCPDGCLRSWRRGQSMSLCGARKDEFRHPFGKRCSASSCRPPSGGMREPHPQFNSMLIHVVRFTLVQRNRQGRG